MSEFFKKSYKIVKDTPFITLYFVLYLIVLMLILPVFLTNNNLILNAIIGILVFLLTAAFLSGWFEMIKTSIGFYGKEKKTPEIKVFEMGKLRSSFFSGVATYILPVIFGLALLLAGLFALAYLSDYIFGKVDKVISAISSLANNTEALKDYLMSMPDSTWKVIIKKGLFSYISCNIAAVCFLFWASSLFLNEKKSLNPLVAILDGLKTMFKKFFETIAVLLLIAVVNFLLISIQGLFISNIVISFIVMILRIYFASFVIVLIFDLYGKNDETEPCSRNNGTDSIRENKALD